jgi:hypothetical protein
MAEDDKQSAPAAQPQPAAPNFAEQLIAVGERVAGAIRLTLREIAARRGMPLTVAGVIVLILAWLSERDSAWGFPMLIAGMALIGLGLIGPRLSGSMALRWGEDGAHFQLSSTVAPPGQQRKAPALPVASQEAEADAASTSARAPADPALIPPTEIEGQAETIEFSVQTLKNT